EVDFLKYLFLYISFVLLFTHFSSCVLLSICCFLSLFYFIPALLQFYVFLFCYFFFCSSFINSLCSYFSFCQSFSIHLFYKLFISFDFVFSSFVFSYLLFCLYEFYAYDCT